MNKAIHIAFLCCALIISGVSAETIEVSSKKEFDEAQYYAGPGDIISWLPGRYEDVYLYMNKDGITIEAKYPGETIFTGNSKAYLSGDNVTVRGLQFKDGNIGDAHVFVIKGSHDLVTQVNIIGYTSHKYLTISKDSQYVTISRCNFENRINKADKNILNVAVSEEQPGFHKIQYCSFRNFGGTGKDMGVEPIRIGHSKQANFESKTIVEFCYFTACNGDGELISNKSSKNIFRYNTFENNPLAELVLRHGSDTYVYSNFFMKGKGGVRIREGSNHFIINNYFSNLAGRSITLDSGKMDPIKNIVILNNTFVNTSKLLLGGNKTVLPKKVMLANNLFVAPTTSIVANTSGKEVWVGNMYQGRLGIGDHKGLKKVNPLMAKNELGLYELAEKSPAVNGAEKNKIKLPEFKDLNADASLSYDIRRQKRPAEVSQKDVGCLEFNGTAAILKPFATSENTGPKYLEAVRYGDLGSGFGSDSGITYH